MNGGAARSCTSLPGAYSAQRGGFSLIELVVVLGVVMVLVGLALPSLQRAWWTGRTTSNLVVMRQNAALIHQYTEAHREIFPLSGHERSVSASFYWYRPLVAAGLLSSDREADPAGFRRYGRANVAMSECMVHPPERFVRGNTQPEELRRATPVRSSEVLFPAAKGLLRSIRVVEERIETYWCCVPGAPAGPVAFADGSASIEYWMDLLPGGRFEPDENGIGTPVDTTWGGVKGRDRQR